MQKVGQHQIPTLFIFNYVKALKTTVYYKRKAFNSMRIVYEKSDLGKKNLNLISSFGGNNDFLLIKMRLCIIYDLRLKIERNDNVT